MDHFKVYVVPAVPVKSEVGLVASLNEPPAPDTIVQAPASPFAISGALAANVTVVRPQVTISVWSGPALAVVPLPKTISTSSEIGAQGLLLIVQRKVYVVPIVPLNVDAGFVGEVIVPPAPETIVHKPVPTAGVFAASVVVPPHTSWSGPASAVVGIWLNVIVTSSVEDAQGLFEIVHLNV